MKVLNVAYPFSPVSESSVGGAEQVLAALDTALVRAGHRSLVLAAEGSHVAGRLYAAPLPRGELTQHRLTSARTRYAALLLEVVQQEQPQLVHMHGIDALDYLPGAGVPVLITLHLPPEWYPARLWKLQRPQTWLHCVSLSQAARCPQSSLLLPPIENGVMLPSPQQHLPREDFALVLGRVCPEKNMHAALDAGHRAGMRVLLGGQVFPYPEHQRYFEREVKPRLDALRQFLGPLSRSAKTRLLARARCLLLPTLAPETSSLVAMEALAAGTPVIAYPSGALPEIVEHGVTGFLVNDVDAMAQAMMRAESLSQEACREAARNRFAEQRMVRQYLSLYAGIVRSTRRSNTKSTETQTGRPANLPGGFALAG